VFSRKYHPNLPSSSPPPPVITEHVMYTPPPTFGCSHEAFPGGHVPDQLPHIDMIQTFLQSIHDTLGLPWWASIVLATIAFRFLFLPLNIGLIRNSSRLARIRPEIETLGSTLTTSSSEEEKRIAAENLEKLFKKEKCHPFLNLISPVVMAPAFLSVFFAVERLSLHEPTATTGGLLWFQDLSVIDPTWVLPLLSGLTWIITIEMGADEPRTYAMQQMRSLVRFLAAVMVPVTGALPQGVFVYWITSNLFSILQIRALQNPKIRSLLQIPDRAKNEKPMVNA